MIRINHAAAARGAISQASNLLTVHEDVAAGAMAKIAVAEATLALVEQQRIANVIALLRIETENSTTPTDALDAVYERHGTGLLTRPEYREALGL